MELNEIIKNAVISSIEKYANNKLKKKTNFQILDLLIPEERKIRNIVGGFIVNQGDYIEHIFLKFKG